MQDAFFIKELKFYSQIKRKYSQIRFFIFSYIKIYDIKKV